MLNNVLIIVSFLVTSACGLKLSPKSEIEDFRPVVPFQKIEKSENGEEVKKDGKKPVKSN